MKKVIYVRLPGCGACRATKYAVVDAVSEVSGTIEFIDGTKEKEKCEKLGVERLPAVIVVDDGKIIHKQEGKINVNAIREVLQ